MRHAFVMIVFSILMGCPTGNTVANETTADEAVQAAESGEVSGFATVESAEEAAQQSTEQGGEVTAVTEGEGE